MYITLGLEIPSSNPKSLQWLMPNLITQPQHIDDRSNFYNTDQKHVLDMLNHWSRQSQ